MQKQKFYRLASALALVVTFQFIFVLSIQAQESSEMKPEMSVAGIELGNRESAKKFLGDGYAPRLEQDGTVGYYFYNKWGNQVLRLNAPSMDDKYFITEIEVFRVGRKYQKNHYQAENIKYFSTENNIFIGFKQSAMFMIAGIKNAGKINQFKPKHIVKIKGEPTERNKAEKKRETLIYKMQDVQLSNQKNGVRYEASYEFYKKKLKRFKMKISWDEKNLAKKNKKKSDIE